MPKLTQENINEITNEVEFNPKEQIQHDSELKIPQQAKTNLYKDCENVWSSSVKDTSENEENKSDPEFADEITELQNNGIKNLSAHP